MIGDLWYPTEYIFNLYYIQKRHYIKHGSLLQMTHNISYLFFPWLHLCPFKICLKVPKHNLMMPITHFGSCYVHLGLTSQDPKCVMGNIKMCPNIIPPFDKKMYQTKGRQGKKKTNSILYYLLSTTIVDLLSSMYIM